ncbi:MAG: hypothetical protein AB8G17_16065 [Gammaproteobacteria bacterium]
MKLRLRDDTLRLRLQQQEVEQLGNGDSVEAHTPLQNAGLTYRLTPTNASSISATLEQNALAIGVPQAVARAWANSDQVAIKADIESKDGATLSVLIEKDFQCLAPDANRHAADDADAFVHPGKPQNRC